MWKSTKSDLIQQLLLTTVYRLCYNDKPGFVPNDHQLLINFNNIVFYT